MDREKLEKAANAQTHFFNTNMRAENAPYDERFKKGFIRGVEWLQSQPLKDRLTEEEREEVRAMYKQMMVDFRRTSFKEDFGLTNAMNTMEDIFGDWITNKE